MSQDDPFGSDCGYVCSVFSGGAFFYVNHHGETGPDHDANEHDVMGKPEESYAYTEPRGGADPRAFRISVIVRFLWTTDRPATVTKIT